MNVTVVGADPEERRLQGRRRDRIDHTAPLILGRVGGGGRVEVRRNARILARHVLADARPVRGAVGRLEEILIAEIQRLRIGRREHEGERPRVPRRRRQIDFRRDARRLPGIHIALRHRAAVRDIGVQRIGRRVAGFTAGAERLPVAHRDAGETAARAHADGAAVLLRAGHPVRKRIVGGQTIDLCGRLIQPRAPCRMIGVAIDADDRALIAAENHPAAIVGMDPELVIVVAAGRSLERLAERAAAVTRSVHARVRDVHEIRVLRIDDDFAEVPAASPDARVGRRLRERRAGIVGSKEPALLRVDDRVDARAVRRRHRDADAADPGDRQAARQLRPVRAAVRRFVQPAARTVRRRIDAPRRTTSVPERRIDRLRRRGIEVEIDRADVVALEEHLLPRGAAVA